MIKLRPPINYSCPYCYYQTKNRELKKKHVQTYQHKEKRKNLLKLEKWEDPKGDEIDELFPRRRLK